MLFSGAFIVTELGVPILKDTLSRKTKTQELINTNINIGALSSFVN